jgi:hypothetical protein
MPPEDGVWITPPSGQVLPVRAIDDLRALSDERVMACAARRRLFYASVVSVVGIFAIGAANVLVAHAR